MNHLLRNLMYSFLKRVIDLIISILVISVLLPLFIPVAIILKLSGEGEIFYLQERVGQGNKSFKIYKFATMLKNSEMLGTGIYTAKNDSRILPFGNFLRKFSKATNKNSVKTAKNKSKKENKKKWQKLSK